jgi:ribosome-binding protein aMBF1 (putative translation factor)
VRRTLAAVPETRGTPVVVLEPITVAPALPAGFVDIDALVEQAEQDPGTKQAVAVGRRAVADNYYANQPRMLAYYRLQKGWSQKELASRLGTSQSYIARLEAGSIDPQVSTLKRLAAALEVQPSTLLDAIVSGANRS